MVHIEWKKVGMGILAASVGAAAFGAVHYLFLAGSAPAGDLFGISYSVILPFVLGAIGMVGAFAFAKPGNLRDILMLGSAASIGFGLATYANWITPTAPAARARATASYPAVTQRAVFPMAASASVGTKMI